MSQTRGKLAQNARPASDAGAQKRSFFTALNPVV
jgi:hypothetical protein